VFVICAGLAFAVSAFAAEPKHWNRDNPNRDDVSEGLYRIPYQKPTRAEIVEVLHRVRTFLETAAPTRVVDSRTGAPITDRTNFIATATLQARSGNVQPLRLRDGGGALRHAPGA
jgi:unsaturated rhamnogalacturonyl hydrolase